MKKIIYLLNTLLCIVLLASCSSRYSRVPKVRAKTKAKTTLTQKVKTNTQRIQSIPQVLAVKKTSITSQVTIDLKQKSIPIAPLQIAVETTFAKKETDQTTTYKSDKKEHYKHTRQVAAKAQKKQAETDFWDTDLGELLEELLIGLILLLILIVGLWLIKIGLGWLVAIILIAIAIFVIVALVDFFDGFFEDLPKFLFWGH